MEPSNDNINESIDVKNNIEESSDIDSSMENNIEESANTELSMDNMTFEKIDGETFEAVDVVDTAELQEIISELDENMKNISSKAEDVNEDQTEENQTEDQEKEEDSSEEIMQEEKAPLSDAEESVEKGEVDNLEGAQKKHKDTSKEDDVVEIDIRRNRHSSSKKKKSSSHKKSKKGKKKGAKGASKNSSGGTNSSLGGNDTKIKLSFPKDVLALIKKEYKYVLTYWAIFAIAIVYWEVIMFIQTGGMSFSSLFFLFFLPAQSLLLALLCGFGRDIVGRITAPILMFALCAFYIVQTVYFRNFSSLFSISMVGMGNEALGDFGWALTDTIKGAIGVIILLLLPVVIMVILSVINKIPLKKYHIILHGICLVLTVVLWLVGILGIRMFGTDRQSPYSLFVSSSANTDTTAKKLGALTTSMVEAGAYYLGVSDGGMTETELATAVDTDSLKLTSTPKTEPVEGEEEVERKPWINEAIDLDAIAAATEEGELKNLTEYFASREPSYTNEYTGLFEGYNLIYICAEGFWTYACNEEVTPTLYKMANNGIILNNYYNSMKNTTTNGEFELATSLWPDVSRNATCGTDVGSFPRSASVYMPQGLGDLFGAQGIPSYGFHNYLGRYYRRILSWPNLGYTCKFMGSGMNFTSDWPASDLEMMEQSVDDYINDDQFHAYYMTFSGHGPYSNSNYMFRKNISEVQSRNTDSSYSIEALGYLAGELELDKAMEYLLNRLEEAGKLDKTVIVIAGDHYPYYLSKAGSNSLAKQNLDDEFGIYKSTCIIYNAGLEEPIVSDTYCCNADIAPTMLNLFNIPFDSRLMMGKDIFSDSTHRAALYNKSFIIDLVKYNYETGVATWTDAASAYSKDELDKYLDAMITLVENEYTASCKAITENIFLHIYSKAGILSEADVEKEIERERKSQAMDDSYNAEDAAANEAYLEKKRQQEEEAQQAEDFQRKLEELGLTEEEFYALLGEQTGTTDGNTAVDPAAGANQNAGAANPVANTDPNAANAGTANTGTTNAGTANANTGTADTGAANAGTGTTDANPAAGTTTTTTDTTAPLPATETAPLVTDTTTVVQ